MPAKPKLKIMVASTVHHFEDQLKKICAVLSGFGYEVWNSHIGTIPVHPGHSNLENCIAAVRSCDVFLGIVRPYYGSAVIGNRSITHEELLEAVRHGRPRWFLVHRDVTFARQLLKPHMFRRDGTRTKFKLRKNPVMDGLRVIEMYNDAIQNDVPPNVRKGEWVYEFYLWPEVLRYINSQFKDKKRIQLICKEMNTP